MMLKISAVVLIAATLSLVMARKPHPLKKTSIMGPANTLEEEDNLPAELDRSFTNDISAEVYGSPMSSKNNLDRVTKILEAVINLVRAAFLPKKRISDSFTGQTLKTSANECILTPSDEEELKNIWSELIKMRGRITAIRQKCQKDGNRKFL